MNEPWSCQRSNRNAGGQNVTTLRVFTQSRVALYRASGSAAPQRGQTPGQTFRMETEVDGMIKAILFDLDDTLLDINFTAFA